MSVKAADPTRLCGVLNKRVGVSDARIEALLNRVSI